MISRRSGCLFIMSVAYFGLFSQPTSQAWAVAAIVPSYQLEAMSDPFVQPINKPGAQIAELPKTQPRSGDLKRSPNASVQTQLPKVAPSAQAKHPSQNDWLLGILGGSAVAGGLTFLGLRRRLQQNLSQPSVIAAETSSPQPSLEDSTEPPDVSHGREKLPSANSHHLKTMSASEAAKPLELIESSPLESPKVSETTRLAKINIVDELLRELRSPDPLKRQKIIWELGQRGDTRAVQPMVDLMLDSDSKQRSLILSALSEIGTRTLKPLSRALAISLQDESPDVRKNAIRDLTRVYDLVAQISHLLHRASDDPDRDVQETAYWALGQLNRMRPVPSNGDLPALKNSMSSPENLP